MTMSRMGIMGSLRGSIFSRDAVMGYLLDARTRLRLHRLARALLGLYSGFRICDDNAHHSRKSGLHVEARGHRTSFEIGDSAGLLEQAERQVAPLDHLARD